jgi:hypothetical protein
MMGSFGRSGAAEKKGGACLRPSGEDNLECFLASVGLVFLVFD